MLRALWWMGVYRSPAVLPDYRSAQPIALLFVQISRKIRSIYLSLQGIEVEAANRYMKWIDHMSTIVRQVKQWDKNSVQSVRGVKRPIFDVYRSIVQTLLSMGAFYK
ncbi:hypothetical protein ABN764_10175 [Paenibacillaceae sp. P-4]|uniref:hypothetical protein n=1 Tax=Paenibacillaceae bacterium P-4 TaxID=3160969 RepID=UPI0032E830D5